MKGMKKGGNVKSAKPSKTKFGKVTVKGGSAAGTAKKGG